MSDNKEKTKKVTISMTESVQDRGKLLAKNLFGWENLSGLVKFLINKYDKEINQESYRDNARKK